MVLTDTEKINFVYRTSWWMLILLMVMLVWHVSVYVTCPRRLDGFDGYDPNNIRKYQVLESTGGGLSDQHYQHTKDVVVGNASTLTGSRDIPVFFQDYDIDMIKKGNTIGNSREGFRAKRSGLYGGRENLEAERDLQDRIEGRLGA